MGRMIVDEERLKELYAASPNEKQTREVVNNISQLISRAVDANREGIMLAMDIDVKDPDGVKLLDATIGAIGMSMFLGATIDYTDKDFDALMKDAKRLREIGKQNRTTE